MQMKAKMQVNMTEFHLHRLKLRMITSLLKKQIKTSLVTEERLGISSSIKSVEPNMTSPIIAKNKENHSVN